MREKHCGLCQSSHLEAEFADLGFGFSRIGNWECMDCGAVEIEEYLWTKDEQQIQNLEDDENESY